MAMRDRYAPELQELLNVPDGSIDDTAQAVLQRKEEAINNYQQRVIEVSKDISNKQTRYKKKKSPLRTSINELVSKIIDAIDKS